MNYLPILIKLRQAKADTFLIQNNRCIALAAERAIINFFSKPQVILNLCVTHAK